MGNRLSKIVTKTGDDGMTGLGDGSRVLKTSTRINAIGDIDELNCVIGLVISSMKLTAMSASQLTYPPGFEELSDIQHRLFDVGGELSIPNHVIINEDDIKHLEHFIERWNAELPYLKNFILPGGSELVSRLHHARAVCRRAERSVLVITDWVSPQVIKYLNRLSDLLFVLARVNADGHEVLWEPKKK